MSSRYSPFVKTDGLILNYDARNFKSLDPNGPIVETYPFEGDTLQRIVNAATQSSSGGVLTIGNTASSHWSARLQEDFHAYDYKILNVSFEYRSSYSGRIAVTGTNKSSQLDTFNNESTWSTYVNGDNVWRKANFIVKVVLANPNYGGISFFGGITEYQIRNLIIREPQPNVVNVSKFDYDGVVANNTAYSPASQSFFFNGEESGSSGIYIKNKSYDPSSGDSIEKMAIECWCKNFSSQTSHTYDQRIVISFDRSCMFRFGIGDDSFSANAGYPSFSFSDSINNIKYTWAPVDLRDDKWHQVGVVFESGVSNGLKFFVDGEIVYSDPTSFNPIGYISETEVPRYGWIGAGSEATAEGTTTGPNDLFYGYISSIKMYEGVTLNEKEIKQNFNSLRGRFGI